MKNLFSTSLIIGALLAGFCLPADARLVVGVAPAASLSRAPQASLDRLGEQLGKLAKTEIKVRRFDNGGTLADWLLRFMELDAALVEEAFIGRFPAGTLKRVADLHHGDRSQGRVSTLVVRLPYDDEQVESLRKAFLALDAGAAGRKLLDQLDIDGVTPPGAAIKKAARREPAPSPPQADNPPAPNEADAPPKAAPAQPVMATNVSEATDKPALDVQPPAAPEKPTTEEQTKVLEPAAQAAAQPPETPPAKSPVDRRLVLFAVLLILVAMLFKATLLFLRRRIKHQNATVGKDTPTVEACVSEPGVPSSQATTPAVVELPAETVAPGVAKPEDEPAIESGSLGAIKVPALLKRCADMPKPVVLRVTKGSCEKLVFFAGGKVSGALTQNNEEADSAMRWKKLGSLLVRESLISTEELDQGLDLLNRQSGLRLGEALLKLGHIDLSRLRQALTRQAKVTIYSMILFPEGDYSIIDGDGKIPPEESVSLDINALIKEAATHQAEWTTIRKTLPNLNMVLDFTSEGRRKVSNVSLSALQDSILNLINGQRTISSLCSESAMMDYEVYRFLYMMVKAGVLDRKTP